MSKKRSARAAIKKTIKTWAPESWRELAYICDTSNLHLQEAAEILVSHIRKRWKY